MSFHYSLHTLQEEQDSVGVFSHTEFSSSSRTLSIEPARALACPNTALRLASPLPLLNQCLAGGLPYGSLSEWGLPLGMRGREVILAFLATATSTPSSVWVLWAHARSSIQVYPPAWQARGVDLRKMRFVKSKRLMHDLKPLFMDPFFKVIILDAPGRLIDEDYGFLARQARRHKKIIMVLHDHFLSTRKGNVWAKLRVNAWQDFSSRKMCLRVMRGLSPRQLSFDLAP